MKPSVGWPRGERPTAAWRVRARVRVRGRARVRVRARDRDRVRVRHGEIGVGHLELCRPRLALLLRGRAPG